MKFAMTLLACTAFVGCANTGGLGSVQTHQIGDVQLSCQALATEIRELEGSLDKLAFNQSLNAVTEAGQSFNSAIGPQ